MKVVDNSASFVVSVPVGALVGVDSDGDQLLGPDELSREHDRIAEQFTSQFAVYHEGVRGREVLTWVVSPETHNPAAPTSYVVVMQRVFFDEIARQPQVYFNLFDQADKDPRLLLKATMGDKTEAIILTPSANQHTFFEPETDKLALRAKQLTQNVGASADHLVVFVLLLLVGLGGIVVRARLRTAKT